MGDCTDSGNDTRLNTYLNYRIFPELLRSMHNLTCRRGCNSPTGTSFPRRWWTHPTASFAQQQVMSAGRCTQYTAHTGMGGCNGAGQSDQSASGSASIIASGGERRRES
jgi:hypothetical protein